LQANYASALSFSQEKLDASYSCEKKGEYFTHCQSHHRFGAGNGGSVGAIVGGVVGGVAFLVLGVLLCIMFYRRRKANKAAIFPSSEDSTQLGTDIVCFSFYVYYPATEFLLTSSVQKKKKTFIILIPLLHVHFFLCSFKYFKSINICFSVLRF